VKPLSRTADPRTLLNAREICCRVTNLVRSALDPSIRVTRELSPQTGLVHGDSRQINQVVLSLILNARDAMPQGGDLLVATSNMDRETAIGIEKFVRIVVADNGAGTNSAIRGGLAIAGRVVRDSGGEMNVRSAAGRGSSFEILLPRVEETGLPSDAAALRAAA
jgi:two-component system cell cycle sensor histidine kinase/response regulator CckA